MLGARWMSVGTTGNDYYPTDGIGGVGTTSAANITAGAKSVIVYRIVVTAADAAATTISISRDDGSDGVTALPGMTFPVPGAASVTLPLNIKLGGEQGVRINGPIAASTSDSDTDFTLFFRQEF